MRKILFTFLISALLLHYTAFSQVPASGAGAISTEWHRGGNNLGGPAGGNNIFGTRWNSGIYTITNTNCRMVMTGGAGGVDFGRIAIGNNLSGNFAPVNRFHLHQLGVDTFGIQFTNSTISAIPGAPTATDGFAMNLQNSGNFVFRQYENRNVEFVMPGNNVVSPVMLMRLTWNMGPENRGQVQIRPGPNPMVFPGTLYGAALLNLGGAIGFTDTVGPNVTNTLMYYNTRIAGGTTAPINDGFRVQYAFNSEGTPNGDGLVFEKTDGQTAIPDGCIKFTNYGTDSIQRLSMTIEGNGHIGIGRPYNSFVVPWRRLSVQDTLPQFRMTYQAANTISSEVYTDFFTNSNGDLHIDPRFLNNATARVVKINYGTGLVQPFPGLSLDVNGQANIRTVNPDTVSTYVLVWDDSTGNIRYRDVNSFGGGLGGACTSPSTAPVLTADWEIPMNANNFVYSDPAAPLLDGENFVGIGTGCTPTAKLEVIRNVTTNTLTTVVGSRFENNDVASNTNYLGLGQGIYSVTTGSNRENSGVYGESKGAQSNYGVRGKSAQVYSAPAGMANFGMIGEGMNGRSNVGVSGSASSASALAQTNKGGDFSASGAKLNYGSNASASNNSPFGYDNIGSFNTATTGAGGFAVNNVGVVGIASLSGGGTATNSYGVYGEGITFGGYFVGGTTGGPAFTFSDQKIKGNVVTIESGLELLKKLNPVTYDHKTTEFPELYLREGKQYGFIAQEVEAVIPELVTDTRKPEFKDEQGNTISKGVELKAINYDGLIPVLTKSIQEQQSEIEVLKSEIEMLKAVLTGNSVAPATNATTTNVELSDIKSIVLDQNTPNPFAEQTTITYTLTDVVSKAQILFYNAEGKLINTADLEAKAGKGSVHVFANDLSNGLYTYTLVADGKIIDTKRMLKNK